MARTFSPDAYTPSGNLKRKSRRENHLSESAKIWQIDKLNTAFLRQKVQKEIES